MKQIGLTGGIGCGKTTVLHEFEKLGIPCFVADEVAGRFYLDKAFCARVGGVFGQGVMCDDGYVDKAELAKIVFSDSEAMRQLNAMVHPQVMTAYRQWVRALEDEAKAPFSLFESAILFDYGFDQYMDATICVYLDKSERIARISQRDGAALDAIEARMSRQLEAEEMMRRADYVILNYEGNPRSRQVRHVYDAITAG